jgi:hypothetical protein
LGFGSSARGREFELVGLEGAVLEFEAAFALALAFDAGRFDA